MTEVFVRLIEGTEVLVPCPAEELGDGRYRITGNDSLDLAGDVTSVWQFFPGDVVRCERRGDINVAVALIDSTMPARRLYALIFDIVTSMGRGGLEKYSDYGKEIEQLCDEAQPLHQREHPIVRQWMRQYCNGRR